MYIGYHRAPAILSKDRYLITPPFTQIIGRVCDVEHIENFIKFLLKDADLSRDGILSRLSISEADLSQARNDTLEEEVDKAEEEGYEIEHHEYAREQAFEEVDTMKFNLAVDVETMAVQLSKLDDTVLDDSYNAHNQLQSKLAVARAKLCRFRELRYEIENGDDVDNNTLWREIYEFHLRQSARDAIENNTTRDEAFTRALASYLYEEAEYKMIVDFYARAVVEDFEPHNIINYQLIVFFNRGQAVYNYGDGELWEARYDDDGEPSEYNLVDDLYWGRNAAITNNQYISNQVFSYEYYHYMNTVGVKFDAEKYKWLKHITKGSDTDDVATEYMYIPTDVFSDAYVLEFTRDLKLPVGCGVCITFTKPS